MNLHLWPRTFHENGNNLPSASEKIFQWKTGAMYNVSLKQTDSSEETQIKKINASEVKLNSFLQFFEPDDKENSVV